jgi:hypothetical protein
LFDQLTIIANKENVPPQLELIEAKSQQEQVEIQLKIQEGSAQQRH